MRTLTLALLSALSLFTGLYAQNSISCIPSTMILCQGSTVVLDYTATGSFDGANTFVALLSDENGSFAPLTIIGQMASSVSGQITCSVPANAVPGSSYHVRVDGTMPPEIGEPNGMNITIIAAPDAGSNGSLALCSNGSPIPLTTEGDPGGTWFDPNMAPTAPVFIPGVSVPGCYSYAVQGNIPCPNDTATLCLTVPMAPNAGLNDFFALCSNGSPIPLSTEGDPGGTWLDPNMLPTSGVFIPGVSVAGCYYYVLQGSAPCPNDTATLCLTVPMAPNAGQNSTITVCSNSAPFNMLADLGGFPQSGGTWTDPTGAVHPGVFNPAVDIPGCYAYAVEGTPPCADDVATLCIFISQAADAGVSVLDTVCLDGPSLVLFDQLGGSPQPGGAWSFTGEPHPPFFIPGVDLDGCFQYLVQGIAPCVDDSSVWCVVVDSCLTLGSGEATTATHGVRQIDGWSTDHPVFALAGAMAIVPQVLDALGRRVPCPASIARREDGVVFSLDLSGLARGGYWVVVSNGMENETLRITKW